MIEAYDLAARALIAAIRPPEQIPLSRWLAENLVLVDGPLAGQLWSAEGAPYLVEIADCLSEDDPATLVTVRKSQQTGASILALGWCLYVAARAPANMIYAVPGHDALRDLNSQKLQPLIDAYERRSGRRLIIPPTTKGGTGSTTYEKRFAGGYIALANANVVMDLSSKTTRFGVKDEVSKWEEIPGYGDPETLFEGRFTAFRRLRSHKVLEVSTPEVDSGDELGDLGGHCRIDRSFRRSDQRFWHVPCPSCGEWTRFEFEHLQIDRTTPAETYYRMQCCGFPMTEPDRVAAVRAGRWIATAEGPDRHPGFHIDAFVSLMMSFRAIAEDHLKCRSEQDRKGFHNLVLGLPYRFRGDAPDYRRLMERREEGLKRGHIPARGLMLVASADVQGYGIYVEVLAVAPNRETWVVDALYLAGNTASPDGDAFAALKREVLDREFPDAFGRTRKVDALGIDTGFRSHVVYSWVRACQRLHPDTGRDVLLALNGMQGWNRPPIGTPSTVDIDLDGRKVPGGARIWPVGTWSLKATIYHDLRLEGIRSGQPADPDGYCHFPMWLDDVYFKQLTSEHLEDIVLRGRSTGKRWVARGDNHFFDCRVYNLALAEHLGLSRTTDAEWTQLARRRGVPEESIAENLFTVRDAPAAAPAVVPPPSPPPAASSGSSWIGRDTSSWMDRR